MVYDTWSPYDPSEHDSPENQARLRERLERGREIVRALLPRLRREVENPDRDEESVFQVLRPYHQEAGRDLPMQPADLPEIESLCRQVLEVGGLRQNEIQEVLLRLVGATAAPRSVPFLLEMLHYSRRGDHFGPQRRQLALWGLARMAIFHGAPEAYAALRKGLDDRRAEVRLTAADLILNAYLDRHSAHDEVPKDVVDKLQQMATSDPDDTARRATKKFLREPWAQPPPEDVTFKAGDSIVVKPKVQDPDLDIEIDGWQGRLVKDPGADGLVMIAWDSITLRNTPDAVIAQCARQGLDWTQMGLSTEEIEPADPRDSAEDIEKAIDELSKKHAWSWLGEEGERIGKVLAGIDPDDEMGLLDAWEEYLAEKLDFPFEAQISEHQERGPLQAGDRLKVTGIGLVDDLYGIIVNVRRGREKFAFPLCDLEVVDKRSPNYQLVDDYAVWFANR